MRQCLLIFTLASYLSLMGQTAAIQGHSYLGGTQAQTSGLKSTNYLDGIVPSATITVYLTGTTTKATIYSDGNETPLGNPFTSNAASSLRRLSPASPALHLCQYPLVHRYPGNRSVLPDLFELFRVSQA